MIPLIKSTFYKEKKTKRALKRFISTADHLSFGKQCERFESKFAAWQGRKYCVLLNSGSSANLAVLQSLVNLGYLKQGDRIGFSAVTWSTNVMPIIQLGLIPVPIDISLDTLNISLQTVGAVIAKTNLALVFMTDLLGLCDDIDEIAKLCKRHHILFVEDACESLGTVYKRKKLGNFGFAGTFSFYVGHHMSTVEGGAVATDDEEFFTMLRLVRAHGWDRNLDFASQEKIRAKFHVNSSFYSRYTFYDLGFNLRPTEITGFLGNYQLQFLDEIIAKREKNFLSLAPELYTNANYYPLRWQHIETVSNFAVPVVCRTAAIRDTLVKMCDGKVEIRPIVGGNILSQPFFKKYARISKQLCPNAQVVHEQGLYFGNNPELTARDMQTLKRIFV